MPVRWTLTVTLIALNTLPIEVATVYRSMELCHGRLAILAEVFNVEQSNNQVVAGTRNLGLHAECNMNAGNPIRGQ